MKGWLRRWQVAALAALLGACAGPLPPDWQSNARSALERALAAYLKGDTRVATSEFERARGELARTGRADLLARAELMQCAARVASLVFDPCEGFERLRADAPPAERAYADFLSARIAPHDIELLPPPQRAVAAASAAEAAVQEIGEPLSRLVAAGVLLQQGRATPAVIALAVDTASAQGWRRPLLAWLKVQVLRAQKAGNVAEAERLRRRIRLVEEGN